MECSTSHHTSPTSHHITVGQYSTSHTTSSWDSVTLHTTPHPHHITVGQCGTSHHTSPTSHHCGTVWHLTPHHRGTVWHLTPHTTSPWDSVAPHTTVEQCRAPFHLTTGRGGWVGGTWTTPGHRKATLTTQRGKNTKSFQQRTMRRQCLHHHHRHHNKRRKKYTEKNSLM